MGLLVLGAGFGRTGTLSLKVALERLGFLRCYHMMEMMGNPGHYEPWKRASRGEQVDWNALFSGYSAAVDWPVARFWKELVQFYPDAKVILTVRDSRRWYESMSRTIYRALMQRSAVVGDRPPPYRDVVNRIILHQTFAYRFAERRHAIGIYERHNQEVQRIVPRERLLVYDVAEGWAPLCRFLRRPVLEEQFPRVNTTAEFEETFELLSA